MFRRGGFGVIENFERFAERRSGTVLPKSARCEEKFGTAI